MHLLFFKRTATLYSQEIQYEVNQHTGIFGLIGIQGEWGRGIYKQQGLFIAEHLGTSSVAL